jgi:phenylpropionate dioxygenase-like ring-hydroxylating dioxygenase large terminal subunit
MFLGLKQDFKQDYAVPIDQLDKKWSVVNHRDFFYLLSNVCPHQNSRISNCKTSNLTCPYHGMQFNLLGSGINNEFALHRQSCYSNGAMLFNQVVPYSFPISTEHFELIEQRQDTVNAPVEVMMDVFLDIDHIPVAHSGVYDQIGISTVSGLFYQTFAGGSIQFVPPQKDSHMIAQDQDLNLSACWMAMYPGTMIEWQPGALFVTVAHNTAGTSSQVQVYKYRDTRYTDSIWDLNNHVWEVAWSQDRALAECIESPAVYNLDKLKQHHRDWIQHAV